MKNFSIAHLSDLHCDNSSEWKENFEHISDTLREKTPNLIVISGDLVHNPTRKNFIAVGEAIEKLYNYTGSPIISVPGNHDYSFWGNSFFHLQTRKELYMEYEKNFSFPYSADEIALEVFCENDIALFDIDSNGSKLLLGFAVGKVHSPLVTLKERKNYFEWIAECKEKYLNSFKIAVLHHHPLPLPSEGLEKKITDNLIFLRNAHEFLDACCEVEIDLILHGHKHISGLAKYQIYNEVNSSTTVSSCGTSNKVSSSKREIKFVKIEKSGSCSVESYFCGKLESRFRKISNEVDVNYYGDIRKNKITKNFFIPEAYRCPVAMVANKEKIVQIRENGDAHIQTALFRIEWDKKVLPHDRCVKEIIWADLGRIWGGLYEFGKSPLIPTVPHRQCEWKNPAIVDGKKPAPDKPDLFTLELKPEAKVRMHDQDCLKIGYLLLNGFTMNQAEHIEAYPDWNQDIPRQEVVSASVNYPTYQLELIVRFPPDYFPDPVDFDIRATRKKESSFEVPMELLYGQGETHYEEEKFLNKKASLRLRHELNEVALLIKYPDPHCVYSLTWIVPILDQHPNLLAKFERGREYILKEVQKSNSTYVDIFYKKINIIIDALGRELSKVKDTANIQQNEIAERIIRATSEAIPKGEFSTPTSVDAFLFGYDLKKNVLNVVKTPELYKDKVLHSLSPGRGPAGRAFKSRVPCFWERMGGDEEIENIIDGIRPNHVLTFPLMYPTKSMSKDLKIEGRLPAFGVLSVVATNENGLGRIAALGEKDRDVIVTWSSMVLDKLIEDTFAPILPR